jgi:hypothetical protein
MTRLMTPVARRRGLPYRGRSALRVIRAEPEWSFLHRIVEAAWLLGWRRELIYHTFDSRRSTPGFPDLVLVRAPRVIFAELKTDAAPQTLPPDQQVWMYELLRCPGVEYFVWRPRHWQEIQQILRRRS